MLWSSEYEKLTAGIQHRPARPLIGITGNYEQPNATLGEAYYRSVLLAGGQPLIIPPYPETDGLGDLLDSLDAILFSGGGDINPLLIGEEPLRELHGVNFARDKQELLLARMAYDRQIPMLGICKGIQTINAALGGKNYQDIYSQFGAPLLKHSQELDRACASHTVTLEKDSLLHQLFRTDCLPVNSFHHQAVWEAAPDLRVTARSQDGLPEAVESAAFKSVLGVQWHPEAFCMRGDETMMPIFRWLVQEARSFREAKDLHRRIITLDSHCDTPMTFHLHTDFATRDPRVLVDLHKMQEGRLDAVVMAAYLEQQERDERSLENATAKTHQILNRIEELAATHCTDVDIAYTPRDVARLKRQGKKAIFLGIENAYAIGKELANVEAFRKRGVIYMTLCHNGDNDVCDSAKGKEEHGGVSAFGREVISEMNRVGMMVDLSHAHERSFYDALEMSRTPILCSHSSCRALCDHPRNLTDEQMKALAKKGGVMQVTLYHGFLRQDGQATILDAIDHLHHAVNVMGIEHVGIGTDFDGDGGVPGCADASELINFTRRLLYERYSEADIAAIWGGNFMRLMTQVQQAATTPSSAISSQ